MNWWHAKIPDATPLIFGMKAMAVARAGKLMEFSAALAIVLDLVGKATLIKWLGRLESWLTHISKQLAWSSIRTFKLRTYNMLISLAGILFYGLIERPPTTVSGILPWLTLVFHTRLLPYFAEVFFVVNITLIAMSTLFGESAYLINDLALRMKRSESENPKKPFLFGAIVLLAVGFALDFWTS